MIPESKTALEQLTTAGRKRDVTHRTASALTVGAMTLLLVGLVALLDYWLMLPVNARWAALLVMAGLFLAGVYRLRQLWRRPTSPKQAALDFEAARPQAGCEVSTAAEYATGERRPKAPYEVELVAALDQQAASALRDSAVPYQRKLVKPGVIAAVIALAFLAFATAIPGAGTALMRALAPWSRAAFTQVQVQPGNIEIAVGQEITLTNTFTGRRPAHAELVLQEEGQSEPTRVRLTDGTNGVFRHTLKNVRTDFAYHVSGGDAVSDRFRVTTYIPPAIQSLRVEVAPPQYTGLKPVRLATPDFSVVRGSVATFQITPNVALSRARLHFTNGVIVELKSDGGTTWTSTLNVAQDNAYTIELFDQKGRPGADRLTHQLTALPDHPPQVDFAVPGQDIRAAATNTIPLKLTARDDFGLAGVKILYHRLGDPEQELVVPLTTLPAGTNEYTLEAQLDLTPLKLNQYEVVAYYAEARDNNSLDGPGIGRSPVYFIEITNEEGMASKSKPKPGQKVNLLIIEKQIIADTTALPKTAPADAFKELAARQQDAVAFGRMYQAALAQTGAPIPVQGEMNAAVTAMEKAAAALAAQDRNTALPAEDAALAAMYQAMRLMPELENLPTTPPVAKDTPQKPPPPTLKVVLEAIKKQKQQPPTSQELTALLAEVQELNRQQNGISTACQNPSSAAEGNPNQVSRPMPSSPTADPAAAEPATSPKPSGAEMAQSDPKDGKGQKGQKDQKDQKGQKGSKNGKGQKGQPGAEGQAGTQGPQGAPGQKGGPGQPGEPGKPGDGGKPPTPPEATPPPEAPELAALAPKEEALSEAAQALAEKINRLAGKGSRLGHGASKRMGEAAGKLKVAARAMRGGDRPGAGSASNQGSDAMGAAATMLEGLIQGRPDLSDVSAEEAPREFEGPIADYFHRLSHAQ